MNSIVTLHKNAAKEASQPSSESVELKTFNLFFKFLFDEMATNKPDYRLMFKKQLINSLLVHKNKTLKSLKLRHSINKNKNFEDLSITDMSMLFEQCYVTLCDMFGPGDSDRIMYNTITNTENNSNPQAFSIKSFL